MDKIRANWKTQSLKIPDVLEDLSISRSGAGLTNTVSKTVTDLENDSNMPGASMIAGVTDQVTNIFRNQGITIFNGVLIVVTISGEQNVYYGGAFLFIPAISLFVLGVLVNGTTWRIVHGCCYRVPRTRHGIRRSCYYWLTVIAQALVAPCAWLFVAFLQGSYYECFRAGDYCRMPPQNCTAYQKDIEQREPMIGRLISGPASECVNPECVCKLPVLTSKYLMSVSQIIAWIILIIIVTTSLIFLFISRCTDRFTFAQNRYINLYRQIEETKFLAEAKLRAEALAEANVKAFFDKENRTKLDWDKISVVPLSEYPHYLDHEEVCISSHEREEPYFTPLDEWSKDRHRVDKRWKDVVRSASAEFIGIRKPFFDTGKGDGGKEPTENEEPFQVLITQASEPSATDRPKYL